MSASAFFLRQLKGRILSFSTSSLPSCLLCFRPLLSNSPHGFLTATSTDDVIESADAAEPLAQRVADAGVGHVTGELAEAGVERRLQSQERGVRQEEDLVQESQDHVGPCLQEPRFTDQYRVKLMHADITWCNTLFLHKQCEATQGRAKQRATNAVLQKFKATTIQQLTKHQLSPFYSPLVICDVLLQ